MNKNISWQGDPCSPKIYRWKGVKCLYLNSDQPRIVSLYVFYFVRLYFISFFFVSEFLTDSNSLNIRKLAASDLNGAITPDIAGLTQLRELWASETIKTQINLFIWYINSFFFFFLNFIVYILTFQKLFPYNEQRFIKEWFIGRASRFSCWYEVVDVHVSFCYWTLAWFVYFYFWKIYYYFSHSQKLKGKP